MAVEHWLGAEAIRSARLIDPDALTAIDALLKAGACRNANWTVTDGSGSHRADDLTAALATSVWSDTRSVTVYASIDPNDAHNVGEVRLFLFPRHFVIEWLANSGVVRDEVELAYRHLLEFLEARPRALWSRSFQRTGKLPWWDLRRSSRSMGDALALSVASGVLVALIVSALTLFGGFGRLLGR